MEDHGPFLTLGLFRRRVTDLRLSFIAGPFGHSRTGGQQENGAAEQTHFRISATSIPLLWNIIPN